MKYGSIHKFMYLCYILQKLCIQIHYYFIVKEKTELNILFLQSFIKANLVLVYKDDL